jgi:hypothetical protein
MSASPAPLRPALVTTTEDVARSILADARLISGDTKAMVISKTIADRTHHAWLLLAELDARCDALDATLDPDLAATLPVYQRLKDVIKSFINTGGESKSLSTTVTACLIVLVEHPRSARAARSMAAETNRLASAPRASHEGCRTRSHCRRQ